MPDAAVSIIIPWQDRGDARRRAVADFVIAYYQSLGLGEVVIGDYPDDGRPLNRSRLRNEGAKKATGDILVFSDADCIVPREQLVEAIRMAEKAPGAVLPYDRAVTNVSLSTTSTTSCSETPLLGVRRPQPCVLPVPGPAAGLLARRSHLRHAPRDFRQGRRLR